jgi:serine/threonine protein kinase
MLTTVLGSPGFMAPEIVEHKSYSGASVDIFASGITLFMMLTKC